MMREAGTILAAARNMPCCSLQDLTGGGPILVLTPHPDDESLGCGGLIAACGAAGIAVHVVLLTDGAGSHRGSCSHPPPVLSALRLAELQSALAELGAVPPQLRTLDWPDAGAPTQGPEFLRATRQLVTEIRRTGAATIFASWSEEPHCDHEAAARIAAAAAAITGIRHLAYTVWGWMLPPDRQVQAGPPQRLDVAPYLAAKRRAVACHRSQLGGIIHDAPETFTLPQALLDACLTESEIFFDQSVAA